MIPIPSTMDTPILQLAGVSKSFGGVQALRAVTFDIRRGETHAIVGENGAGKSTLMNILAGVYAYDSGQIALNGQAYAPANPYEARAKGISIVFQELALFPALPVEANLFVGKERLNGAQLDHHAMREATQAIIQQMAVALRPTDLVGSLAIGEQQWVEIARALTDQAQVLILDEPNSALNQYETQTLFRLIDHLKAQGITILYISHRLEEVFQIADRITVIRDGEYVGTWAKRDTTISAVVTAMVGRKANALFERQPAVRDNTVLEVENLSVPGRLLPLSFCLRSGEVVGVVGLLGSGTSELFGALFGVESGAQGKVKLDQQVIQTRTPREAMRHAIAMVPADRRNLGLMLNWSVLDNMTFAVLDRLSRYGVINAKQARQTGKASVDQLHIITDSMDKGILRLSGGNQQKALLARWLAIKPRLLILDDPTRGIDVGAKREIYTLIDAIAAQGVAVLLTSSEIEETLALSDRILVLRDGRLVAELPWQAFSKTLVTELMAGDLAAGQRELAARLGGTLTPTVHAAPARPSDAETQAAPPRRFERALRRLIGVREVGVLLALLLVVLTFSLLTPYFFTASNLLLITQQMAILGMITVGMTFVLAAGEVDLSVGWIFNMAMTAMALLMKNQGLDAWLTIPAALLLGAVLGAVNGLLAIWLELPTIIVTLGTLTLYRGLALTLNGGRTVRDLPASSFFQIGSGTFGSVSYMTIIMLVTFVIGAWLLRNTRVARHWLAIGGNTQAAERLGLRTKALRVAVMTFSGLLCGAASVIGLAFLGAADAQSGAGYELTAIAAAVIGGAQLGGGSATIWGSLIGITMIIGIQNGLSLMGLRPAWQIASTGILIIVAATVDYLTRAYRKRAVTFRR